MTHQFDVFATDSGDVHALFVVQWTDPELAGVVRVNGLVRMDLGTSEVVPTVDGDSYYSWKDKIGTSSLAYSDAIYKFQYLNASDAPEAEDGEEWHGNGVHRFVDKAGAALLAVTHRFYREAFLVKDPWTYGAADGADAILQRFGTPPHTGAGGAQSYHVFGVGASAAPSVAPWSGGVHNVFYTPSSATSNGGLVGKETISLFINSMDAKPTSYMAEFELKLAPQSADDAAPTDAVFDARYSIVPCGFYVRRRVSLSPSVVCLIRPSRRRTRRAAAASSPTASTSSRRASTAASSSSRMRGATSATSCIPARAGSRRTSTTRSRASSSRSNNAGGRVLHARASTARDDDGRRESRGPRPSSWSWSSRSPRAWRRPRPRGTP